MTKSCIRKPAGCSALPEAQRTWARRSGLSAERSGANGCAYSGHHSVCRFFRPPDEAHNGKLSIGNVAETAMASGRPGMEIPYIGSDGRRRIVTVIARSSGKEKKA